MSLVDELDNLRLECLEHGWVKAIFEAEFLEFCDLPSEYESAIESLDLNETLTDIINSTANWLESEDIPTEEKSWASLTHLVQHKKVLAILAYYIDFGCKNVHTKEYRDSALLASRVYYKLLTIPGFKAYHIYHSQLFAHSLACLRFPLQMCDASSHFSSRELIYEVNRVLNQLSEFVEDLTVVVKHLQLNPTDMNFEEILNNLLGVTSYAIVDKLNVDKYVLSSISKGIYKIIQTLVTNAAGTSNEKAVTLLFKCILPKLVNSCLDGKHANKYIGPSYVTYSFLLLATHTKAALHGYLCLLEHLCLSPEGLERAEVRDARSKLVVGMMSCLPPIAYREFLKWLTDLSVATKVTHRHLALEVLAKLLEGEHGEYEQTSEQTNEAMNIDEPVAGGSHQQEPNDQDQQSNVAAQPPPDFDEDNGSHLRQRKQRVMHAPILRAVYYRADDDASAVRTRALAILTKCLSSKHVPLINAIKKLNDSGNANVSRLMALAARSAVDERAAVRKSAATLLLLLLADHAAPTQQVPADPDVPTPESQQLVLLVTLCRDASIIVRTSAIAALGELMTSRPSLVVMDAVLDGPLHQISDPETKVQEQVKSLVERLLINRLRKFTPRGCDDELPWMFLAVCLKRKEKQHLQKACLMLSKSSTCINHRLVDILSTHLGAMNDQHDLECLLLLTSVAPYVEYSDVAFVLEYYYKLTENEQSHEKLLLKMTLELLGSWIRYLSINETMQLRDHLIQRLSTGPIACRIICAQLAYKLDPDNATWLTEKMQLLEHRAVVTGDLQDALRAADLSIAAAVEPKPALLRVLLAIADQPPEWENCRATAVLGVARLCVRSRPMAVEAAPVLARLLARADEQLSVRFNALVGLSDICARYTCIVEPLLGIICDCLSKGSPYQLRRKATRELTRLLLGGFLRLRPPLYYRYCALLTDQDSLVRDPALFYVTSGLTVDTIYHHFVDCVLHYNQDEKFDMTFDDRQLIYDLMMQRMSLVQKLNIQCRLAQDVLNHAADLFDEDLEISKAMNSAVLDALSLLNGPRLKLPKKPQKTAEMNDLDDLQERVTTNIVSHKMKSQVAEVLVPAVLRLYNRLKSGGGQTTAHLVQLANDLFKDYEPELREIMEDNEELMKDVQTFQSIIGVQQTFGNVRNLVTRTAPPEPDTPRTPRRPARPRTRPPRKQRALRM